MVNMRRVHVAGRGRVVTADLGTALLHSISLLVCKFAHAMAYTYSSGRSDDQAGFKKQKPSSRHTPACKIMGYVGVSGLC